MVKEEKISKSLDTTLKNSELVNVTTDLAEIALDSFLDEGILKEIPILGSIVGLGKVATSISDRLFVKKLIYFLSEVSTVNVKKRNEEIKKIEEDPEYRDKIGEKLLFILDKCEDHNKSKLIAKFFVAFLNEEIAYSDYLQASSAINQTYIDNLMEFVNGDWSSISVEYGSHLLNSGILYLESPEVTVEDQWDPDMSNRYIVNGGTTIAKVSSLGDLIREILTEDKTT